MRMPHLPLRPSFLGDYQDHEDHEDYPHYHQTHHHQTYHPAYNQANADSQAVPNPSLLH